MTVGIDNPAFEDFLDSEDENVTVSRVDENSNELNSAEKKAQFQARQESAENETGTVFVQYKIEMWILAKNDDSESEEEAQEADFGSQDPKVVQLNPAGNEIVKCRITRDRKGEKLNPCRNSDQLIVLCILVKNGFKRSEASRQKKKETFWREASLRALSFATLSYFLRR